MLPSLLATPNLCRGQPGAFVTCTFTCPPCSLWGESPCKGQQLLCCLLGAISLRIINTAIALHLSKLPNCRSGCQQDRKAPVGHNQCAQGCCQPHLCAYAAVFKDCQQLLRELPASLKETHTSCKALSLRLPVKISASCWRGKQGLQG